MSVTIEQFGELNNEIINKYVLKNSNGMSVSIINYGATITDIEILDSDGVSNHVACGFDTLEGYFNEAYLNNAPYFGCTVGRFASRIKDGLFSIDGQQYEVAINNGSNHLHGGMVGFDKKVWRGEVIQEGDVDHVAMHLTSPHLEEGYPGTVALTVSFGLTDQDEILITYSATTDQTTPLSLTNHTYFNLSGFKKNIESTKAQILSDRFLAPDETNVPVGEIALVEGTIADLRSGKDLGSCFQELTTGFEHYYAFKEGKDGLEKVAQFEDIESGRKLEILTTEPGALFYTGYFTSDELQRENGDQYGRYRAFCFETSRYPNGPNLENMGGALSKPGEVFESKTIYRFTGFRNEPT